MSNKIPKQSVCKQLISVTKKSCNLASTHLAGFFLKFANMNSCKLFLETANTLVVAQKSLQENTMQERTQCPQF